MILNKNNRMTNSSNDYLYRKWKQGNVGRTTFPVTCRTVKANFWQMLQTELGITLRCDARAVLSPSCRADRKALCENGLHATRLRRQLLLSQPTHAANYTQIHNWKRGHATRCHDVRKMPCHTQTLYTESNSHVINLY